MWLASALQLLGIINYDREERVRSFVAETLRLASAEGIKLPVVSGGGTGTQKQIAEMGCTEARMGCYCWEGEQRLCTHITPTHTHHHHTHTLDLLSCHPDSGCCARHIPESWPGGAQPAAVPTAPVVHRDLNRGAWPSCGRRRLQRLRALPSRPATARMGRRVR